MKRTDSELRDELAQEMERTIDLPAGLTVDAIRRRSASRRSRPGWLSGVASASGVMAILAAFSMGVSNARPTVQPDTNPIAVDPSFPPVGNLIATGVRIGTGEELVIWFTNAPGRITLASALVNRMTGRVRPLEEAHNPALTAGTSEGGFRVLGEIDARSGRGVVDYGLFIGAAARVTVTAQGDTTDATISRWSGNPAFVVFWATRAGTPLPDPTDAPPPSAHHIPNFVAYNSAGAVIGTSNGARPLRSDMHAVAEDRPMVGDRLLTGAALADGGELVLWFVGDTQGAHLKAGARHPDTEVVTDLKNLGAYHRPPFDIGFYHGWSWFAGAADTIILVGTYVGPATRVAVGAPGIIRSGSGRWSAHPETIVFWAIVPTAPHTKLTATAYDKDNNVMDTLD